jgi:hypothetical protein
MESVPFLKYCLQIERDFTDQLSFDCWRAGEVRLAFKNLRGSSLISGHGSGKSGRVESLLLSLKSGWQFPLFHFGYWARDLFFAPHRGKHRSDRCIQRFQIAVISPK